MDENKTFELLSKMYNEMQNGFNSINNKMDKIEGEVKKNSIKLESIETKLKTVAEIQKSNMEQNERAHNEIIKPLGEKISVIELAVKDTSNDMKDLKDKFDKVEKVTIQNTYDVAYLKSVK